MGPLPVLSGSKLALFLLTLALFYPVRGAQPESQLEALHRAEALTREKKWPEAGAAWQRVVDANPHLGPAWLSLALARYEAKDYRQAIPAFAKARELGAGYPANAAYNIACCHALLGEKEPA